MLGVLMAIGNGIAMGVRINIGSTKLAWKAFKGMRQSGKSYIFTQNNS